MLPAMPRVKIEAFFREFPFLSRFFNVLHIHRVFVKRIAATDFDKSTGDWLTPGWDRILILDEAGRQAYDVGVRQVEKKWYRPATWNGYVRIAETIRAAMVRYFRNTTNGNCHFIVICDEAVKTLTVLKPPRGYTVQTWLAEMELRQAQEVRAEIEMADSPDAA